jgi:hypothetical protein
MRLASSWRIADAGKADSSKLHKATGWNPSMGFKQMILDLLETAQNG